MRIALTLSLFLASLFFAQNLFAWGSATGFETHQYIDQMAYQELQKDPALKDSGFPTQSQILANEGVYYLGDGESIWSPEWVGGPGPDRPGSTNDADHYYNPRISSGNAPNAVALRLRYLAQSIAQNQGSQIRYKSAAWGAHFLADMSVAYHINGLSKDDLLSYYNSQGGVSSSTLPLPNSITGPLEALSYHMASTHSNNFKREAERYLTEAKKTENSHMDWFDPWYWNGAISSSKGSSHIEWEMYQVTHTTTGSLAGYNPAWKNPAPTFDEPWNKLAPSAINLATNAANLTLDNEAAWAADPAPAIEQSVRNVATLWRASFSALRPQIKYQLVPDENTEEGTTTFKIQGLVKNLANEVAQNVATKLSIVSGGELLDGTEIQEGNDISANGESEIGEWKIKVTDPKNCYVSIESIAKYSNTPDLQYAKKNTLVKKPEFDGNYIGTFSGDATGSINFVVNGTSVNGSIIGTYEKYSIEGSFSGSITANGVMTTKLNGVIHITGLDKPWDVKFTGQINGTLTGQSGSGNWNGKNSWGTQNGEWKATKK